MIMDTSKKKTKISTSHVRKLFCYDGFWCIFLSGSGLFRAEYSCHGWWEEMGVSYLITTPLSRASTGARRYCFVFRETLEPQQDNLRQQQRLKKSNVVKSSSLLGYPSGSADDSSSSSLDVNPEYSEPEFKRILHFSSIADSCRRNVAPGIQGDLAFNVTSHGKHTRNKHTLKTTHNTNAQVLSFFFRNKKKLYFYFLFSEEMVTSKKLTFQSKSGFF